MNKQEEKKILPFISIFNPNNPEALPITKETLENWKTSDCMINEIEKVEFITCKCQASKSGKILFKRSHIEVCDISGHKL